MPSPTCVTTPAAGRSARTGGQQCCQAQNRRWVGTIGQATVEFALALPIVLIVILGMTQVGVAIRNELAVELAAREGARAASVSAHPVIPWSVCCVLLTPKEAPARRPVLPKSSAKNCAVN